jgi:IS30 family transposase
MAHLSYEQRYTLEVLFKTNKSNAEIASILSVDKSVIYRKLKRNDGRNGKYKVLLAQRKYENRLVTKHKKV